MLSGEGFRIYWAEHFCRLLRGTSRDVCQHSKCSGPQGKAVHPVGLPKVADIYVRVLCFRPRAQVHYSSDPAPNPMQFPLPVEFLFPFNSLSLGSPDSITRMYSALP